MTHDLPLLTTLCGALVAALAFGLLAQRVGLSPIVGYLLAGVVVGPATPGYVAHQAVAGQFAEVGVVLLLFGVGLHFHVEDLWRVRRLAMPGAVLQLVVTTSVGCALTMALGWSAGAGVCYGLAAAVASTVVLTRVLAEHGQQHTPLGQLAIGWLVVEDVLTVLALVLLPAVAGGATTAASIAAATGMALLKLTGLVAVTWALSRRAIPGLLAYVARTRSRELFTLTVLALALGIAVAAAKLFGASMALGAFLAGMIVGQSTYAARAAADALPMRDAFAVLFFVSVGMLLEPQAVLHEVPLVLGTIAIVLLCKPLAIALLVRALGGDRSTAVRLGTSLAQMGEFSFILAALGRDLGILPASAPSALVLAAMVSITLNPLLFRAAARWAEGRTQHEALAPARKVPAGAGRDRVIVVGYGPVGRALVRILRADGLHPYIVELNASTVEQLVAEGTEAVYGDATQPGILEHAGVERASSLIFTADGPLDEATVTRVRELNPRLVVMARARYASDVPALERAGARVVVASEVEVALAMAEHLLTARGASPEQLDQERARVRAALAP